MNEATWLSLLDTMTTDGTLFPSTANQLDVFEQQSGVRLPASYRSFCRVFGPGTLGGWYEFAAPGYTRNQPERWELTSKNAWIRAARDWEEYAPDPAQFGRSIVFAGDQATGTFLFDPAVVTAVGEREYAVFAVWRDYMTERVCDTFAEFISICLHRGNRTLYDEPPELTYSGPWQGR